MGAGGVKVGSLNDEAKDEDVVRANRVHNCIIRDGGKLFPVLGSVVEGGERVFLLGALKADCLATEVCVPNACKPGSGCC
jgi:hypothetical protein